MSKIIKRPFIKSVEFCIDENFQISLNQARFS